MLLSAYQEKRTYFYIQNLTSLDLASQYEDKMDTLRTFNSLLNHDKLQNQNLFGNSENLERWKSITLRYRWPVCVLGGRTSDKFRLVTLNA